MTASAQEVAWEKARAETVAQSTANPEKTDNGDKKVRIYIDGCWDACHSGHYNALRQAKGLADNVHLIVGIHTDEEIRKHKRNPVMCNEERRTAIAACKWCDEVAWGVPYVVSRELLDKLGADYVAHGDDMPVAADGKSAYHCVMDKLKIFKRTPGVSTTNLIERLLAATCADDNHQIGELHVGKVQSWSQFLSTSHRLAAFSNKRTPKPTDKVVYVDGVFDLFHIGHIQVLQKAKQLGDFLYVGIYDDTVVQQEKGTYWPIQNLQERTLNVLACRYVDEVIIGCPWEVSQDLMQALKLDVVVISANTLLKETQMERYAIAKSANKLQHIETESTLTTVKLARRISARHDRYRQQNQARLKKEETYHSTQTYVQEN